MVNVYFCFCWRICLTFQTLTILAIGMRQKLQKIATSGVNPTILSACCNLHPWSSVLPLCRKRRKCRKPIKSPRKTQKMRRTRKMQKTSAENAENSENLRRKCRKCGKLRKLVPLQYWKYGKLSISEVNPPERARLWPQLPFKGPNSYKLWPLPPNRSKFGAHLSKILLLPNMVFLICHKFSTYKVRSKQI